MVRIKYVSYLADIAGINEEEIEITKPTHIKDLLKINSEDIAGDPIVILKNQRTATLETLVENDDQVIILPAIDGGSTTH